MFTGLVESIGFIEEIQEQGPQALIAVHCEAMKRALKIGDSVAVNGVCLTVVNLGPKNFHAYLSSETIKRTRLGTLRRLDLVNLELPVGAHEGMGGHFVQGHVDGLGRIRSIVSMGDSHKLTIEVPQELLKFMIEKGSVAIDGVSLTINDVLLSGIELMIIPHTWEKTIMHKYGAGDLVHIEVDLLAKYVNRLVGTRVTGGAQL